MTLAAAGGWPAWSAVALGAVVGAWGRYALAVWLNDPARPVAVGTWVANLVGALLIGLAAAWLARHPDLTPLWRLFIMTGMLGALTTFSTFSLESLHLVLEGQWAWALGHTLMHVIGCFLAAAIGYRLLAA